MLFRLVVTNVGGQRLSNNSQAGSPTDVRIDVQDKYVIIDNGILRLTLSNPGGIVTGVQYNGVDNLLEVANKEDNRGYWSLVWSGNEDERAFDRIQGTNFKIIFQSEEQVEVSFTRTWTPSLNGTLIPLNIDKRFVVLRGSSGFYTYAIIEHLEGWPEFDIGVLRVAFKLRNDKFHYMALSDKRQRIMPMPEDRKPGRSQQLAYPEAVLLTNPINPDLKGEVDDKYQYSIEDQDNKVHGWISFDPPIGFWQISPSDEARTGGPVKQDLTSHVGPTTLAMQREVESWPYSFPASEDFQKSSQRGSVSGKLLVRDRYINGEDIYANGAYVGLALPGEAGSWQRECKGYQFWTRADASGSFSIKNVLTGQYNLYAWVPGFLGDYKYNEVITITSGNNIDFGDLIYEPPRQNATFWEIGIPDRSAAEFYIPDPNPKYVNRLYINDPDNRFRQYGLWERYADLYPDGDLVYTIGTSDYKKDWFFAHVTRKIGENSYQPTTWQIKFHLDSISNQSGSYKLRVALASAAHSELQVRFNDLEANPAHFTAELNGRDNAIARHGIHGCVDGACMQVIIDNNIVRLMLSNPDGIVIGVQYNGVDNLMETHREEHNGGYWDIVWNGNKFSGMFDKIKETEFRIILQSEEQVEVSFKRTWTPSRNEKLVPLNIDKRFVMLRGSSGFYTYAIFEHRKGWPDFDIGELRVAFKLRKDKFHYMAISDTRQRIMPMPDDRSPERSQRLAYPEAVLLTNPINPQIKGEVDDKYQYSCEDQDNKVHGWISFDPPIGFWQITPSDEFRTGGPTKQDLTSHVGPTTLAVIIDNGILQLTLSNPDGIVTGVRYNGVDNLLEVLNKEDNRGYWDLVWNGAGNSGTFDVIKGTDFRIIFQDEEQVEVSFTRTWTPSLEGTLVPLNIDKRFVVLRGCSGFYTYAIYEHLEGWPDFDIGETRIAFKLRKDKFYYMAISDDRQRIMPMPDDRMPGRCQQLAYPEAVLLTNPINPDLKGEVDDKYQYSCEDQDIKVHGWISFDPPIGFWQITPSDEFRAGGPVKQNLTSHVGPTTLSVFVSAHYAGQDVVPKFRNGEYWKKVFGPLFIYLNSSWDGSDPKMLWEDAKIQVIAGAFKMFEMAESALFEIISAIPIQLFQKWDKQHNNGLTGWCEMIFHMIKLGYVPQGYQFWTRADENGSFTITNVRTGDYNLYAWVPGFIGDYKYDAAITITSGNNIDLGDLVFEPPRDGVTLWEIGIPDRSAAEFYIPDPNPKYVNRLYVNDPADRFRQYGLWERYADLYPDTDLVYTIGDSDYKKDWFFAQVTRKTDQNSYQPTTWQIKFHLDGVDQSESYKLRVALASATLSELQGYQFWTRADENGSFTITNVRTGDYNLYAWVPGFIGDYKYDAAITITSGNNIDLGDLVFEPPRDGVTLWEIGIPDRSAAEFYIPDPNPKYVNRLYVNDPADRFRQYGLWERYADLYPDTDLVYTIGDSDYKKDWFFAQVTRKTDQNSYQPTTWQIKFHLDGVDQSESYKLRVALASATLSELQVRFNDSKANPAHFTTGLIGDNTVFLTQSRSQGPFQGIMYDYIRMEGPSVS
ncbi:putative rhamnogalacturonate lyase B [Cocos nucifera]|uniref:rhamnogalacturonan endolyase n=1 Tax=Cocos nucifera TaxID=13894 RepID=A0A8K0N7E9_COCNU|nr:putative rhamnogalacturonate lyase B [Cocos nucifera]